MMHVCLLGICEHCNALLDISDMPVRELNAVWKCPKCQKEIELESFGYDLGNIKWRWVKKKKIWAKKIPKHNFMIGDVRVVIRADDLVKNKHKERLQRSFRFKRPTKDQTSTCRELVPA